PARAEGRPEAALGDVGRVFAGGDPRQAGTGAGTATPRRARRPAANSSPSPAAAHAVSTAMWKPAPAPSKNPVLRSRFPPAPGGIRRPIAPAGSGSISGALPIPENGLPIRIIVSAPTATPAGPSSAWRPATT